MIIRFQLYKLQCTYKYNYNLLIKNAEEDVSNQIQGVSLDLSAILDPKEEKITEQIERLLNSFLPLQQRGVYGRHEQLQKARERSDFAWRWFSDDKWIFARYANGTQHNIQGEFYNIDCIFIDEWVSDSIQAGKLYNYGEF